MCLYTLHARTKNTGRKNGISRQGKSESRRAKTKKGCGCGSDMGIFDGILLMADWDNTTFYHGAVPEENRRAIAYFEENGGLFSVCTGRYPSFIGQFADQVSPNTYVCGLNGEYIVNLKTGEVLADAVIGEDFLPILRKIIDLGTSYHVVRVNYREPFGILEFEAADIRDNLSRIFEHPIYKIVLRGADPETEKEEHARFRSVPLGRYSAEQSSPAWSEFFLTEYNKAGALRRLKEATGAKLTVAVGDYDNDVPMLRAADISYAMANATDAARAAADRMTTDAKSGGLAKIVEDLKALSV